MACQQLDKVGTEIRNNLEINISMMALTVQHFYK